MKKFDVVIVGAGFTGLSAAYYLSKKGYKVQVIESDENPGGLAGTFNFSDGVTLEKFYHHWFNNDNYVFDLIKDLGLEKDIITLSTQTGMYFNGRMWKLSTPLDLLKFTALPFIDRIRLGLLVFKVRHIKDWHSIEHLNIREWLEPLCGQKVFKVVWEPLIKSKFSIYAELVGAVWMWKKLVLRGSTRNKTGEEELAYFKGGFGRLAEEIVSAIEFNGGSVEYKQKAVGIQKDKDRLIAIKTNKGEVYGKQFIFTTALPIIANIFDGKADSIWISSLLRVKYLGNICLVLRLKQSLSDIYWVNVNEPDFPFVGVIEHTNFDTPKNYSGSNIVFLSRYIVVKDPIWNYSDQQYLSYALKHLKRMFPDIKRSWILEFKVWREEYAQPIMERQYSKFIPDSKTPFKNARIATMAQIYPEDRGTNYAIRDGQKVADDLLNFL